MTDTVNFGDQLVSPEEKTRKVGEVFSSVARRYDVMNDLMSGGMHRLWKDRFVSRVKPQAHEHILDMAGGTGDIAFRMAKRGAAVTVSSQARSDGSSSGIVCVRRRWLSWSRCSSVRRNRYASTREAPSSRPT